jgi:hypothetical protein
MKVRMTPRTAHNIAQGGGRSKVKFRFPIACKRLVVSTYEPCIRFRTKFAFMKCN